MTPLQFTRNVRSLNRMRNIARVLTRHGFGHAVTRLNLGRFVPVWMLRRRVEDMPPESAAAMMGRRLARVCTELGPTFIKLGQMLSTRPDLLPTEVIEHLRLLQDKVPPFDTSTAMQAIEQELGKPIHECFEWIDEAPLASASIGQVYRARLIGKNKNVVVKVRRPDIDQIIELDMQLLRWLAQSLESLMPESRIYRPTAIVAEFAETMTRELDYIHEASATARFGDALADDAGVRIPKVFWELTSPRVLTLEALPGANLESMIEGSDRDAPEVRIDRPLAARRLADCFLRQVFDIGLFHADPHPGNILIEAPATIGLIDFGQTGTITDEWMTQLVVIVYACVNREVDVAIDALTDMGAIGPEADRRSLHRALRSLLEKYYGLPIRRFDLRTLFNEFSDVVRLHDVTVPRDFIMLIKAYGTVAGVTARLDPELNLLELLKPRLKKNLADRFSPKAVSREALLTGWHLLNILREAPSRLRRGLRRMGTGGWRLDVRHENIDRLIGELDRSSNRLAFSIVIAAIIIGSSVVVSARTEWTVFGISFQYLGIAGYLLAGVLGLGLSWAIFRSGRLH